MSVSWLVAVVIFMTGHVLAFDVGELNTETFRIQAEKKDMFVMFYAPWCGHCQQLHPTWEELADKMGMVVYIVRVDCTVEEALCEDVPGYPTLKLYKSGTGIGIDYTGSRDISSLSKFIREQLGIPEPDEEDEVPILAEGLYELTEASFNDHISEGHHFIKFYAPWCPHCQALAPVWEDLAKSLEEDDSVSIGNADCTELESACSDLNINGYPTLLWIKDGNLKEEYFGGQTLDEMKSYVARMTEDGEEADKEEL